MPLSGIPITYGHGAKAFGEAVPAMLVLRVFRVQSFLYIQRTRKTPCKTSKSFSRSSCCLVNHKINEDDTVKILLYFRVCIRRTP